MRMTLIAAAVLLAPCTGVAQVEYAKLVAPNNDPGHGYGTSLRMESGLIAVGAPGVMNGRGAVFVYDGITLLRTIMAPDGTPGDGFGGRIALDAGRLAVTAKGHDLHNGALYLFDLLSGAQHWKVTGFGDGYGQSVAIQGNLVAVGAPNADSIGGGESGAVRVYDALTGQAVHTLGAPEFHHVGVSVALSDGFLASGALGASPGGAIHVYSTVTGHYLDELRAEDWASGDRLGESIFTYGDLLLAGARGDDGIGDNSGAAYLFRVSNGEQLRKLTASDGAEHDLFGYSVALSGTTAVVGARQVHGQHDNTGAVYVFDVESGMELQKLEASDGDRWDFLGAAVAAWGEAVVATAEEDDDNGPESGSVYVFARPCQASNYCAAQPNSTGAAARIAASGSESISGNIFTLECTDAARLQFGLFFYASQRDNVVFGDGLLCVRPPIYRLLPAIVTDGTGSVSLVLNHSAPPASIGPGAISPFSTWNFQFWYRDPTGGPAGFNLSDGLEVTFCP